MSKVNIIYWSGTGNTERMANAIADGAKSSGADVKLMSVDRATEADVTDADVVAFGCSAMGDEELEEEEMRPFMDSVNPLLSGKKIALFGSYEWADGEWMVSWEGEINEIGCDLVAPGLIAYDDPDDDAIAQCEALGTKLATA